MSALEEEIIAKIRLLDKDAQRRVIALVQGELDAPEPFDHEAWWRQARALRESIQAHLGEGETIDTLALLDEVREDGP
jgi:hypothetical protein